MVGRLDCHRKHGTGSVNFDPIFLNWRFLSRICSQMVAANKEATEPWIPSGSLNFSKVLRSPPLLANRHKWRRICSTFHNQYPVVSSFMTEWTLNTSLVFNHKIWNTIRVKFLNTMDCPFSIDHSIFSNVCYMLRF